MLERYPNSNDPLAEPAIVLVDEIDLHLHPTWQRQLIGHLTEHFPATQFIVTAHSPLVVQASGDANMAVLRREGDQVKIVNDVEAIRGWRIDQIYTSELFGLPSARPPEFDGAIERRKELLLKDHLTEREKKELKELEAKVMSLPGGETPEQRETLNLLKETLSVLQREQKPAS
jgi:predicted ATP-binding protein involved in virulence